MFFLNLIFSNWETRRRSTKSRWSSSASRTKSGFAEIWVTSHFLQGLPDFSWHNTYTKMGENIPTCYKMATIYSTWPNNIPTFSIPRPSKIDPNWDFYLKTYHQATLFPTHIICRHGQGWLQSYSDWKQNKTIISLVDHTSNANYVLKS
jgi:hypothetical protein